MPPSKKSPARPRPVEAITHNDTRINLPTADAEVFVDAEVAAPVSVLYPRDPTLDPQLVWKGKDEQDQQDLIADAPPIYIQEKIDPRVLIENLRQTGERPEDEPELTLFDTFDGLDDLDIVDFYKHDANWSNRMILGDSLNVMASLTEREALRGKVQMVYIDPPYGIKFNSNWQVSTRTRDVKDGKIADATREVEQIKAFRDTWELGIHSYLSYLRDRLNAARELLTDSGSVFVQIGDENVHLVRALLDEVFGSGNFVSQITLTKAASQSAQLLAGVNDFLLWYAVDRDRVKYRQLFRSRDAIENPEERYICVETPEGSIVDLSLKQKLGEAPIPPGAFLRLVPLNSQTGSDSSRFAYDFEGRSYRPPGTRGWSTSKEGLARVENAGRMFAVGTTLLWKHYHQDFPYRPRVSLWDDIRSSGFSEKKVYVVQTQLGVIERCLLMCTDPGDLVIDPTCGSGSTAVAAEQWGRRWITIALPVSP